MSTWTVVAPCGAHSLPYMVCAVPASDTGTRSSSQVTAVASAGPGATRQLPAVSSTVAHNRRNNSERTENYLQLVTGNCFHRQSDRVCGGGELHPHRAFRDGDQSPLCEHGGDGDDDLGLGEDVSDALPRARAEWNKSAFRHVTDAA